MARTDGALWFGNSGLKLNRREPGFRKSGASYLKNSVAAASTVWRQQRGVFLRAHAGQRSS